MALIEEAREKLATKERIPQVCKEIFTTARDMLKVDGVPMRNYLLFRYIGAHYKLGNSGRPVDVLIGSSGRNLDTSSEFGVEVEGVGALYVKRKGKGGRERFQAKEYRSGSSYGDNLDGNSYGDENKVRAYLATVRSAQASRL